MSAIVFVVDRRENGQTLAAVLHSRYGLSWAQAKRLIERRHVKVSGQVETDSTRRLKVGKQVELAAGTVEGQKATPAPAAIPKQQKAKKVTRIVEQKPRTVDGIEIVYADESVVVVNKAAGLTTVRTKSEAGEFGDHGKRFLPKTLADLLPAALGAPNRAVIAVHRIDRDTSGLVVFARTRPAASDLLRQFRDHKVDRRYLALTRGIPSETRIESTLVRDRGDGRRGSSSREKEIEGRKAITHVRVLRAGEQFAEVECRLETGRTHQVRIHLGESHTPLCGETVYDRPLHGKPLPDASGATRPMLHAAKLGFRHPKTGEMVSWTTQPPADYIRIREAIRGR